MTLPPPDQSRDRRVEDPTNLWVIHPLGRLLLPWFVRRDISANAVSIAGLALGVAAALAYSRWGDPRFAVLGLLLSVGWLVADGLDGMIARATGTASPVGRVLDGLCDHGVFAVIYIVLAWSVGTAEGWFLAAAAAVAHGIQSNLYEGERARFHRRVRRLPFVAASAGQGPLVRLYDKLTSALDAFGAPLDEALCRGGGSEALAATYRAAATPPMRLLSLLSANVRVWAIFVACLMRDPRAFWWFELLPLTAILIAGLLWHRRAEARLVHGPLGSAA